MSFLRILATALALAVLGSHTVMAAKHLRLAVTTSFENSGLASVLLPAFRKETGIQVDMIAVGTGQALRLGRNGDVDMVLVHSKAAELRFIEEGFGTERLQIMYNDFVIVGPRDDPAKLGKAKTVDEAIKTLAAKRPLFASRGDDSGTHKKEQALWKAAGVDLAAIRGQWYRSAGAGMGATLNMAAAASAYALADRGTWLKFRNKQDLAIAFQGDPALHNQYALLLVNPNRHPHVKAHAARVFRDWLVAGPAQKLIGGYRLNGERLFTPNAGSADK